MQGENQALRLAQMVQSRVTAYPSYELVLPLVEVGRSKLKKLKRDDVILLHLDTLEFVLVEREHIYADLAFKVTDNRYYLEIVDIDKRAIKTNHSKKYETLKVSFGTLQSRKLEIGYKIDITQRPLQDVTLVVEGKIYASGTLVNVNKELAVKIDKVEI